MTNGNVIFFIPVKIPYQPLCEHIKILLIYIHTEHCKLISAYPVCLTSYVRLQGICHLFDHSVPILMTVIVIYFLHSIDVDIDNT